MTTIGLVVTGLASLVVAIGATALAISLLRWRGALDIPNARSSHDTPVVRGAGVGPAVATALATVVGAVIAGANAVTSVALIGGSLLLGAMGLVDDLKGGTSAAARLAGQGIVAGMVAIAITVEEDARMWLAAVAVAGCLWLVSVVNAFNFMDGINGISALTAAIAGLGYAVVGARSSNDLLALGGAAVAGASLGFLPFNFPRARAFLGDVGSYFLGMWLATLALIGFEDGLPWQSVCFPVAVYLADTGWTLVQRARRGESLTTAHRDHAYQRLSDLLGGHAPATVVVALATTIVTALGVVTADIGAAGVALCTLAAACILVLYLMSPWMLRSTVTGRSAAR